MTRGVRLYLVGSFVLVSLAGCGRGFFQSAEREPWRAEAEIACLKSGAVKESAELVRIDPISGPGVCGAEFPLKVAALGESSGSFGFADESLRPPGNIGNQPRWPISQPPLPPASSYPATSTYPSRPIRTTRRREPTAPRRRSDFAEPRRASRPSEDDIDLPPEGTPGVRAEPAGNDRPYMAAPAYPSRDRARRALFAASRCRRALPAGGAAAAARAAAGQFRRRRSGRSRSSRRRRWPVRSSRCSTAGSPIPCSRRRMRWFGARVVEIKQISAYSCRGMNGNSLRAYFRARLRQRARYRGLHARRRKAHFGEGRLEGAAGRAGLSARRAGHGLPAVHHRAGAGLQRLSLRSHPRRSDAPRLAAPDLPAGRDVGRGGRRARGRGATPMLRANLT